MADSFGAPSVEPIRIGPHTLEIENDCAIIRLDSPFTLAHIKKWCSLTDDVIAAHGQLFTISDLSVENSFPSETRQHISRWPNVIHICGAAIVGANSVTNVVFSMIARATTLVRMHTPPTVALKTESEARAWVAELRLKQAAARR